MCEGIRTRPRLNLQPHYLVLSPGMRLALVMHYQIITLVVCLSLMLILMRYNNRISAESWEGDDRPSRLHC